MKTTATNFAAPWDSGVKVITLIVSGILAYVLLSSLQNYASLSGIRFFLGLILPVVLFGLGLVFIIKGYSIDADGIVIHRLFWTKRIPRENIAKLSSPFAGASRGFGLCGIWGFCSFSGLAYSGSLGLHVIAANSSTSRVVVSRHRGLDVVLSPSDADAFIEAFDRNAQKTSD